MTIPLNASEILNHTRCALESSCMASENSVILMRDLHISMTTLKKTAACNAFPIVELDAPPKIVGDENALVQTMWLMTYIPPASPTAAINDATTKAPYKRASC